MNIIELAYKTTKLIDASSIEFIIWIGRRNTGVTTKYRLICSQKDYKLIPVENSDDQFIDDTVDKELYRLYEPYLDSDMPPKDYDIIIKQHIVRFPMEGEFNELKVDDYFILNQPDFIIVNPRYLNWSFLNLNGYEYFTDQYVRIYSFENIEKLIEAIKGAKYEYKDLFTV